MSIVGKLIIIFVVLTVIMPFMLYFNLKGWWLGVAGGLVTFMVMSWPAWRCRRTT